ncbi:YkgJ family cysteine cluster protein [Alkaliphilus hydrothermalis]|uniref:Fe-S-cluster containining protein n=1 Tax=Alkaliphilus hydrothermalis TaxID=1482730 RepID=A0ABS2NMF4_9FIRM|nr:YkgJ family cysteine cluster protein [Alkaliphilus hydrothermalis]MBM7614061.1 Fe-S-cluster containining protein [Alkaliphilus hydrothermalis]
MIEINNGLTSSFDGLSDLLAVYGQLEDMISNFKSKTNLACINKCSKCCNTSCQNIEVTVFEMIPLSIYLWQQGLAENLLEILNDLDEDAPCVLYNPSPDLDGGCTTYQWRPLLCRLFGFSAILNKAEKPVVSLCKYVKQVDPQLETRLQNEIDNGLEVPINSHFARTISMINPTLGQKRYSINEGLRLALEMVGFKMSMLGLLDGGNDDDNNTDNTPPKGPMFDRSA